MEFSSYFRGVVKIDKEERREGRCIRCGTMGRLCRVRRELIYSKCFAPEEMRIAQQVDNETARLDGMD